MIRCTVGVMAYNEEHNIVRALHAVLNQRLTACQVIEIVVVASGCTDRTVELAEEVARAHLPLARHAGGAKRGLRPPFSFARRADGSGVSCRSAADLPKPV